MAESAHRIVRAWLESPATGIIELDRDWTARTAPRFSLGAQCPAPGGLAPAPGLPAGRANGYFFNSKGGGVSFVLPLEHGCDVDATRDTVYLAGDFNGWSAAVCAVEWQMRPAVLEGERVLLWTGDAARFLGQAGLRFKFVTGEHQWINPPGDAPNGVRDADGNFNRVIDPTRTGWHLWRFTLAQPLSLAEQCNVVWADAAKQGSQAPVRLAFGNFFYELQTDLPLGALVRGDETVFRIFAPRATAVTLWFASEPDAVDAAQSFALMQRLDDGNEAGVWEIALDRNLHGWFYWYQLEGSRENHSGGFNSKMRVLDPYALAAVGRDGPGIVIDPTTLAPVDRTFVTPPWQDLVIAEVHVRDLAAKAPVKLTPEERRGFTGLQRWVESPDFYLHHLGANCVELQPVHEFDNVTVDEYHWGYMTNNFFAPDSSYALAPEKGSGLREFQALVAAFHARGMAVIVDVVFNHVGEPAHLMFIDRLYYFEQDASGTLTNFSGCGNDVRARSAMARRLIVDSCLHYVKTFGVDGFRFDLAELLGVAVLRDIETALKKEKPDVILIAEPWSFRGHIAGALRDTGWASWNDGYRKFMREYVRGYGGGDRMEYFLRGSPWYFAKWPAQTINYTESHDDRTWIDDITENPNFDGSNPTANDRVRTHLMAALLFMSVGVPMIAEGQDFLRSKRGINNTYQRGDINALDYRRLMRHLGTHSYFADWIAFRRGEFGRLLRHWTRPSEGFFRFVHASGSPAFAVVYNADGSKGTTQLLFAVNPTHADLTVALGEELAAGGEAVGGWKQIANHERFFPLDRPGARAPVEPDLYLAGMSCGLWLRGT